MNRQLIQVNLDEYPESFHPLLRGCAVYDSSCSPQARVWFLDTDGGYYLKTAAKGALAAEAEMTRFFHSKHLGAQVLAYEALDRDWLLTRRVPGEDCCHREYLDDPKRLCDTLGQLLRQLHSVEPSGCPIPDHTQRYVAAAERSYRTKAYTRCPENKDFPTVEEAWRMVQENAHLLKTDTLLHGDYCLPNVMLDHWRFTGFIDLGTGGVGDRHVDLYWGAWSLRYNLKTDAFRERFLDAYGRESIEPEMLRVIAAIEVFG